MLVRSVVFFISTFLLIQPLALFAQAQPQFTPNEGEHFPLYWDDTLLEDEAVYNFPLGEARTVHAGYNMPYSLFHLQEDGIAEKINPDNQHSGYQLAWPSYGEYQLDWYFYPYPGYVPSPGDPEEGDLLDQITFSIGVPLTLENPTLHHPLDTTLIPDGAAVTHNTVTASGVITDPQGEAVQLELELKKTSELLDGTNTILSSTTTSSVTIEELIPKDEQYAQGGNTETFHYRMRARTEDGRTSAWTEPQTFTTKVVPLFTQVESEYPPRLASEEWADKPFAGEKGNYVIYDTDGSVKERGCGRTFAQCACAIASLTMLGHYYNIRTGVDGAELNPFNLDAWLVAHKSYTEHGGVVWSSALAYMGTQEENGDYASQLTHDHIAISSKALVDSYVTSNNPAIVYNEAKLHYLVLDGKLGNGSYTVSDPAWYNTVTLDDTLGATRVQAYQNTFKNAHLFGFHDIPQVLPRDIQIRLASPAELVIIAPDGSRLGFDPTTNTQYNEIIEGTYYLEGNIGDPESTDTPTHYTKNIRILNPADGAYTLKVIGTGSGPYTLSTRITDSALTGTSTTHIKDTSTGHTDTYELTFDPEGEGFTVKTIDELLTELRQTVYNTPAAAFMTMTTIRTKADAAHEYYAAGDTEQTIQTLKELKSFVKDHTGQDITPAQSETIVTEIKAILVLLKA